MIRTFPDAGTEDLFCGRPGEAPRKTLPESLWRVAGKKLDVLDAAERSEDLRVPPGNRLEARNGHRAGQHSIRINERYRICFPWSEAAPEDVEVVDYHPEIRG